MNHQIGTRKADLAPQCFGRALNALTEMNGNTSFRYKISQRSNQIDVVIDGVFFSDRRMDQLRVTPGTRCAFRDKAKSDSLSSLREKGDQRRTIVASEIEAQVKSP